MPHIHRTRGVIVREQGGDDRVGRQGRVWPRRGIDVTNFNDPAPVWLVDEDELTEVLCRNAGGDVGCIYEPWVEGDLNVRACRWCGETGGGTSENRL